MKTTGARALLSMLADSGVTHLFGNPGTSELPLNDALFDEPRIRYILGLQEIPVMAMADGYAMASRGLGVVNLHISCGLGNAMGMLYNAFREGTPLVVTAGQQDRRLKFQEPILWGDMVAVAKPWTKWACEVERLADLPSAVRRAVNVALTPPTGPVFLSLPMDLQMEQGELDVTPPHVVSHRVRPPTDAIRRAVAMLASAKNPAILAGSRVQQSDGVAELVRLAERLGAPVFSEPGYAHGRLSFPSDHPLNAYSLPFWAPDINPVLSQFDVLLVLGMDFLREYVQFDGPAAVPQHLQVIHCDESPIEIGKNQPVTLGVLGDTKMTLTELDEALAKSMTNEAVSNARRRADSLAAKHDADREQLRQKIATRRDARPMHGSLMMETIARVLPPDAAVIEEAVTTTGTILERLGALRNTDGYFAHRGWALGWGLGCAMGAKLAWPARPVLAILGEGAAMYGIQGLWSAAHHKINVTFVIANNSQYQILKNGAKLLGLPAAQAGRYIGMDLTEPTIDMVSLAQSLGVPAERISEPDALADTLRDSLTKPTGPRLYDVTIASD